MRTSVRGRECAYLLFEALTRRPLAATRCTLVPHLSGERSPCRRVIQLREFTCSRFAAGCWLRRPHQLVTSLWSHGAATPKMRSGKSTSSRRRKRLEVHLPLRILGFGARCEQREG